MSPSPAPLVRRLRSVAAFGARLDLLLTTTSDLAANGARFGGQAASVPPFDNMFEVGARAAAAAPPRAPPGLLVLAPVPAPVSRPPPADAAPEQHEHLRRQCGDGACAPPRRLLRKVGDAKFAPGAEQGAVVALLDTHPSMPFAVACFSDGSAGILRV